MSTNQKINKIMPSRQGRIMIEKWEGMKITARRYANAASADRLKAAGWIIFVPSKGGWVLDLSKPAF